MKEIIKYFITLFFKIRYLGKVKIKRGAKVIGKTTFEGGNVIGRGSYIKNSTIGYGTYMGSFNNFSNTSIGKYCSLGSNIEIVTTTHPTTTFVSTHPAFYSITKQAGFTFVKKQLFNELKRLEGSRLSCIIENDVWIGNRVIIIGGIKIGNGSIIGTGSVVTKNVKPYSIVGGIPAKIIRNRFEETKIDYLLNLQWWNKEPAWLESHADDFSDIDKIISSEQKL